MVVEKAYGKINLTLKVLSQYNGYHSLESLMVPTKLYDLLEFTKRDDDEFVVEGVFFKKNSILEAAKLFQEKYHIKGANIKVTKVIPAQGGMAGGNADSSATLRGLNRLYDLNIDLKELEPLAEQLGSDSVFCLYNKAALCYGRGNAIEFLKFPFKYNCLIVKPQFGLSTAAVYDEWRMPLMEENTWNTVAALKTGNYDELNKYIFNDLFLPAAKVNKEIIHVKNILESFNVKAFMTGSGSSFFILHEDVNRLREIADRLKGDFFVYLTTIENE